MVNLIVNQIVTDLAGLAFLDKITGLVKPAKIGKAGAVKTIPLALNLNQTTCNDSELLDYCPDNTKTSIIYFENGSSSVRGYSGGAVDMTANFTLICWFNYKKINVALTDTSQIALNIIKHLNTVMGNINPLMRVFLSVTGQDDGNGGIFSKYTYIEDQSQYITYPYGYVALNLSADFSVRPECIDDLNEDPDPCVTPPYTEALELEFDAIANADTLVGDASDVDDWNTYFSLPANGGAFTSVSIHSNTVWLYGGAGITLKTNLFLAVTSLIAVNDYIGCITTVNIACFRDCTALTSVILPVLTTAGVSCFRNCALLTSINLPVLETIGGFSFAGCTGLTSISFPLCTDLGSTTGNNAVFDSIIGNTITATVHASRLTCNAGAPDGDLCYLHNNNTLTINGGALVGC